VSLQTPLRPNIKKHLFVSSGKVFLLQSLGMLLAFCLQALVSRTCGAAAVGGFALFVAWLGILSIITVPGLEATLVFFLPRYEDKPGSRRKVVRFCMVAVGTISSLVSLSLLGAGNAVYLWAGLPPSARIPFAITVITFSFSKLLDALFLGLRDAPAASYFNVIRTVLRLLFCLPAFLFPKEGWSIILVALTCEGCATLTLRAWKVYKQNPELILKSQAKPDGERLQANEILSTTAPMFGISITDGLYPFLDKAILGAMLPLAAVGIYRVADSVASLNSAFVAPFVSFWPYISKLYKEDRMTELCEAYRSITLVIIALLIPFSLILIQMSGWILSLFGPIFAQHGRTVLLILSFGCVVDAIAGPAGAVLKMTRHSRLSLCINTVLLVIYFALSVALTKAYGVVGIATARAAVIALGNVANVSANYLLLKIFPYSWKHAWLLMLGALIFAGAFVVSGPQPSTRFQFLIALGEFLLFAGTASIILRSHFGQLVGLTRKWMSGQPAIAGV
jgi:O-antigen/teichoic acid export membrane protein